VKDVTGDGICGATVGKAVLERSGWGSDPPGGSDQVIRQATSLSAGQGMNPGRQVGVKSGVPVEAPG
jgi:acetyl-CoA C-acetyltransferase